MSDSGNIKKFELKKINIVGFWNWDSKIDKCGICKNNLTDKCIECYTCESDDESCKIAWGECNHVYHLHCISGWTKVKHCCPLCQETWKIERIL